MLLQAALTLGIGQTTKLNAMKVTLQENPIPIRYIGRGQYYVSMNVEKVEHEEPGFGGTQTETEYKCDLVKVDGEPTYPKVVEALIRERYNVSDELAIQRQMYTKTAEFEEYNSYCEWCKAIARPVFFRQGEEGGE